MANGKSVLVRHSPLEESIIVSARVILDLATSQSAVLPSMVPSNPTVQLEVVEEWRVWSTYMRSGWDYDMNLLWTHTDLMDIVPEYDELHAFPSLKPDLDILLPPPRSRKQRGWYHKVTYPNAQSSKPPVRGRRAATGADIPPELIHLIGDHLSVDAFLTSNRMGAYTLVCRHWARSIQARMFETVTIDTHARFLRFLRFLTQPLSRLRIYVNILYLSYTISFGAQFLHMLPKLLRLLSTESESVHTTISLLGPLPDCMSTIRSIYSTLPRTLPQTLSSCVTRLELFSIHFQCFEDVAQLLCELPALNHLQARQLTWAMRAIPAGLSRKLQQCISLGRVLDCTATDCTQYWPFLWLCGLGLCITDVCSQMSAVVEAMENSLGVLAQLHAVSYGPPEGESSVHISVHWLTV